MTPIALQDVVGTAAGLLTTLSALPTVLYVWRTGHTRDLRWGWLAMLCGGCALWTVYGALRDDVIMVGANALTLTLNGYLAVRKGRNSIRVRQQPCGEPRAMENRFLPSDPRESRLPKTPRDPREPETGVARTFEDPRASEG